MAGSTVPRRSAIALGLALAFATLLAGQSRTETDDVPFAGVYFDEPLKLLEPFVKDAFPKSCSCVTRPFELMPRVADAKPGAFGGTSFTSAVGPTSDDIQQIRRAVRLRWRVPSDLAYFQVPQLLIVGLAAPPFTGQDAIAEAVRQYVQLAPQGHAQTQAELGYLFAVGLGVPQDDLSSAYWYGQAAIRDLPDAQIALAAMYATGRGVLPDEQASAYWIWRTRNQRLLADLYACGFGVARNLEYARHLYETLADMGQPEAQYQMGTMHQNACGVALNDEAAREWFEKAANQGHPEAQIALSEMHSRPTSFAGNPWEAYYWALLAVRRLPDNDPSRARAAAARDRAEDMLVEVDQVAADVTVQTLLDNEESARVTAWEEYFRTVSPPPPRP